MRLSRLAKGFALAVSAIYLAGCASVEPNWDRDEPWYDDIEPLSEARENGSIYDSRRHGLLLGVGNKYNVGDLIVVEVDEQTNAMGAMSNSQRKDSRYTGGFSFGVDGDTDIEADIGFNSGSQFRGEGRNQKSHSLTGDITAIVKRVMPNGNLVIEGRKEVELSNGREVVGLRGIIRESDVSTVNNTVPSSKVANAHIYYKGAGDSESVNSRGIMTRTVQSKWWPF